MKKLFIFLFMLVGLSAVAQTNTTYIRSRVVDSTTVNTPSGYGSIYYNEKASKWQYVENGVKYNLTNPNLTTRQELIDSLLALEGRMEDSLEVHRLLLIDSIFAVRETIDANYVLVSDSLVELRDDITYIENNYATVDQLSDSIGAIVYTGISPTKVAVGGMPAGTAISNKSPSEIIELMCCPYLQPAWVSFTGGQGNVEDGTTLTTPRSFTANTTPNDGTYTTVTVIDNSTEESIGSISLTNGDGSASLSIGSITLSAGQSRSWHGEFTDTNTGTTRSSSNTSAAAYHRIWWNAGSEPPESSAEVRAYTNTKFHTGSGSLDISTGSTATVFVVVLPSGRSITSSKDLDTNANINICESGCSQNGVWNATTIEVNNAAGTPVERKMYVLTNAAPYSSHTLQVNYN